MNNLTNPGASARHNDPNGSLTRNTNTGDHDNSFSYGDPGNYENLGNYDNSGSYGRPHPRRNLLRFILIGLLAAALTFAAFLVRDILRGQGFGVGGGAASAGGAPSSSDANGAANPGANAPAASTPEAAQAQTAWPELCERYAGSFATLSNGRISPDLLTALSWAPHHTLRPDAAAQLELLNQAYRAEFGVPLTVVSSYRTILSQLANAEQMPELAAEVGTSNHGWGIAIDVSGGAGTAGTPEHQWLRANAPEFGWVLPPWADVTGSKPELWHWEFWGTPTASFANSWELLDGARLLVADAGMVEVDPAMWLGNCW